MTSAAVLAAILTPGAVCDEPMHVPPSRDFSNIGKKHPPKGKSSRKKHKRPKWQDKHVPDRPTSQGSPNPASSPQPVPVKGGLGADSVPPVAPSASPGHPSGAKGTKTNHTRSSERSIASTPTIEQLLTLSGDEAKQKLEAANLGLQWAVAGKQPIGGTTMHAVGRFKNEMRQGRIVGGVNGNEYWQFVHRETVAWIAEGGYCNERYEGRKNFAAKLHTDFTKEARYLKGLASQSLGENQNPGS